MTAQADQKGGGGGGATELDLTKPGVLWAKVEWENATTFHIVLPQKRYTANQLTLNPQVDAGDMLMQPFTVAWQDAQKDAEKLAKCDLDTTGRAGQIMENLTKKYETGMPRVEEVYGLYIATARDGNRLPDAQVAQVKKFKLISIPSITIKPLIDYLSVKNFKGECCGCPKKGVKEFSVEVSVTGAVSEIEITTSPEQTISADGKSGKGKLVIPIQEGKKVQIKVPAPFNKKTETKQVWQDRKYVHYYPGGWRTNGQVHHYWASYEREIWDGGKVTLRVAGTGGFKGIVKSLAFTAEAWAAEWLEKNPPPPLWHNVC